MLTLLRAETNPDQATRDVSTIWDTDRWFTFPKFEETAKNVAAIMRRAGLEDVEIGNAPADGVTQAGFWTEPLAWDVHVGTLEIVEPAVPADQRVLATAFHDLTERQRLGAIRDRRNPARSVITEKHTLF